MLRKMTKRRVDTWQPEYQRFHGDISAMEDFDRYRPRESQTNPWIPNSFHSENEEYPRFPGEEEPHRFTRPTPWRPNTFNFQTKSSIPLDLPGKFGLDLTTPTPKHNSVLLEQSLLSIDLYIGFVLQLLTAEGKIPTSFAL